MDEIFRSPELAQIRDENVDRTWPCSQGAMPSAICVSPELWEVALSGSFAALALDTLNFAPQSRCPPRFPPDVPFASFLSTIFRYPIHQTVPKDFIPHHAPTAAISGPFVHGRSRRQEHVASLRALLASPRCRLYVPGMRAWDLSGLFGDRD